MNAYPSLTKLIGARSMNLVKAFIDREKMDFKAAKDDFTEHRLQKIDKALELELDNYGWWEFRILSLGNTGVTVRQLTLATCISSQVPFAERKIASIILCPCGKPTCWGNLNIEKI